MVVLESTGWASPLCRPVQVPAGTFKQKTEKQENHVCLKLVCNADVTTGRNNHVVLKHFGVFEAQIPKHI